MKNASRALLILLAALLAPAAWAAPGRVGYQGRLLDAQGNPREGQVRLDLRLYAAPTGAAAFWSETHDPVELDNGFFALELGETVALDADLLSGTSAYLELEADPAGPEPSEVFSPRQRLLMTPFVLSAERLSSDQALRINAGGAYSTFTLTGDLLVAYGLETGSASFTGSLTASSGTFTAAGPAQFSLETASGVFVASGSVLADGGGGLVSAYGVHAASAVFSAASDAGYGLESSSGLRVAAGTLLADGGGGLEVLYGLSAASAALSGAGDDLYSIDAASGIRVAAGSLQVGASDARTLSEDAGEGALLISSNAVIAGSITANNFNWVFLASASLSAAGTTLTVGFDGSGYLELYLEVSISGVAAANTAQLRFNGDGGANYGAGVGDGAAAPTSYLSQMQIPLQTATSANPGLFVVNVRRASTLGWNVYFDGVRATAAGTAPTMHQGAAYWSSAAGALTSVTLLNSAANNFTAGTALRVFGIR
ncbi:MAG: hypothetical protein WC969_09195 [Elusimicrobiota bacterium]|jgi:hypothetical protein